MLGETGPCAKFQLDRITGSGSFFIFVFPPAQDRQTERERDDDRDGGEVNIRDLKIAVFFPEIQSIISYRWRSNDSIQCNGLTFPANDVV